MLKEKNQIISGWVHEYGPELYRYARSKMPGQEVAEDVVQNTFIAALQSFSAFEGKSSPKTWLFSILKHKIMDYHREQYRKPEQVELITGGDFREDDLFDESGSWKKEARPTAWDDKNLLDDHDFNAVLHDCLQRLPAKWYSAIQMKYLAGADGDMISSELGVSPANFWQILHRAKLQLRVCLETNWFRR